MPEPTTRLVLRKRPNQSKLISKGDAMGAPARKQLYGSIWESLYFDEAKRSGLLARKAPLSCRVMWKGRIQLLPSQLDYQLADRASGRVGFFDCKCFEEDHFVYSQIDSNQLEQAVLWNEWNIPAGFVIFFRSTRQVVFFPGYIIANKGPQTRFTAKEGTRLGDWSKFSLKPILAPSAAEIKFSLT